MTFPGSAPGDRPELSTFVITPVQRLDQTFDDLQQGIRIDNLSYVWLYVEPLRRFVPPLRLGWRAPIVPASRAVKVTPLPSPTGQSPSGTGGHINIGVSTYLQPDSEGSDASYMPDWGSSTDVSVDYPSFPDAPGIPDIELTTTIGTSVVTNDIETYNVQISTDSTPNTTKNHDVSTDIGTDVSMRLRILQLKYIALGGNPPLCWVEVHTVNGGGNPIAYLGVSPAMPTDWIIIPDSGIYLPYQSGIPGIDLFLKSRSDKGGVDLRLLFGYHPVEA